MSTDRLQLCVVFLLSGMLCVTSMGFATPVASDQPNPEQLVLEAVESTNSESIQGVRTEVFQRADQFEMVTVEVTQAPPTQSRIEVIDSIQSDSHSDVTVINGSTRWQYYQEQQQAVQVQNTGQWQQSAQRFGTNAQELLNEYVVEYEGTTTVEDRQTHVVELSPPEPKNLELSLDIQTGDSEYEFELQDATRGRWYITEETWWIDTETDYPVKKRIEWTDEDGETIATTIQKYHELTVGAEINRTAFGFEPPNGTDVSRPSLPDIEQYQTRDRAGAAAEFTIPEPDIPAAFELQEATVRQFETSESSVLLTYNDGSERVTMQISDRTTRSESERVLKRGVGSFNGALVSVDGRPSLTWECGGLSHRVTGFQSAERLIGVAESVGCQTSQSSGSDAGTTPVGGSPVSP